MPQPENTLDNSSCCRADWSYSDEAGSVWCLHGVACPSHHHTLKMSPNTKLLSTASTADQSGHLCQAGWPVGSDISFVFNGGDQPFCKALNCYTGRSLAGGAISFRIKPK